MLMSKPYNLGHIKIPVSESCSANVQTALFNAGCRWSNGEIIQHTDMDYLFVSCDGVITMSNDCDHYDKHKNKSMGYQDVISSLWDGEGLPQHGSIIEYNTKESWRECEFIAIKHGKALCWDDDLGMSGLVVLSDIRPIRTEAEKRREAEMEILREIIFNNNSATGILESILDAGFTRGGSND